MTFERLQTTKNVRNRHIYWSFTHYILLQSNSTQFHVLIGIQKSFDEWKCKKNNKKGTKTLKAIFSKVGISRYESLKDNISASNSNLSSCKCHSF